MDTSGPNGKSPVPAAPTQVGMTGLRFNATDVVNRTAYKGERFLITSSGKALAALVTIEDLQKIEAVDAGKLQPVPPPVRAVA